MTPNKWMPINDNPVNFLSFIESHNSNYSVFAFCNWFRFCKIQFFIIHFQFCRTRYATYWTHCLPFEHSIRILIRMFACVHRKAENDFI